MIWLCEWWLPFELDESRLGAKTSPSSSSWPAADSIVSFAQRHERIPDGRSRPRAKLLDHVESTFPFPLSRFLVLQTNPGVVRCSQRSLSVREVGCE